PFSLRSADVCYNVSLSPVSAAWQLCLMPPIPRLCWRRITFRPWLVISAWKSSHMRPAERRIFRPFLIHLKAKLTPLYIVGQSSNGTRIGSLALNMRLPTTRTCWSRECLTDQTLRFCSRAQFHALVTAQQGG